MCVCMCLQESTQTLCGFSRDRYVDLGLWTKRMGMDSLVCHRAVECVCECVCVCQQALFWFEAGTHTFTGRASAVAAAQFVSVTDDE